MIWGVKPLSSAERALAWPLAWKQDKTPRLKASSLLQKEVTVNLLRQVLNVSGANSRPYRHIWLAICKRWLC
jgi:hypothetical protein